MRRRLLAGFLIFTLLVIVVLEVPLGLSITSNARNTAVSELQDDGTSLGLLLGTALERQDAAGAQALISRFASDRGAIVLVVASGKPYMSAGARAAEEIVDPGVKAILTSAESGRSAGEFARGDPDDDFLYAALPIAVKVETGIAQRLEPSTSPESSTAPSASSLPSHFDVVLLVAEPAAPLHARIADDWISLAAFGVGVLAMAAAAGTLLARSLTRPLAGIEKAVAAFGSGSLSDRAPADSGPAELRALGRTVNAMADRLEELLQTQRAFVADASHQLRTPMTALRLRLENLEESVPADKADLSPVIAEVDRLSHLVDGLLALARTEGARPARQPVDVQAVLAERVEAWAPLAEERQVTLTVAGVAGPMALACPGHLEQVLDNLLSNALDATPAGGSVQVSADRLGEDVDIHVVDDGPGMSAADRARAFDRFWRPEGATHDGTGLGLAIAAQLVRVSGGSTWLEAADSGGIDAVVRLEAC